MPELRVEPGGGRAVHEVGPPPAADAEALAGVELGAVARVRNQVVGGVLRNLGADPVVRCNVQLGFILMFNQIECEGETIRYLATQKLQCKWTERKGKSKNYLGQHRKIN